MTYKEVAFLTEVDLKQVLLYFLNFQQSEFKLDNYQSDGDLERVPEETRPFRHHCPCTW